jgi:transglutaminase-like putative cysteine protease
MSVLHIRHETTYRYRSPVTFGEHRMMLRPRESRDQRTLDYRLEIDPTPTRLTWSEDVAGNAVAVASFARMASELKVVATMTVEQTLFDETALTLPDAAHRAPIDYGRESEAVAPFLKRRQPDPDGRVDAFAADLLAKANGDVWACLKGMNEAIRHGFEYLRREAPGIQTGAETLALGSGTCRDFAMLMSEAVRSLGIASRFVSGYLYIPHEEGRVRHAGGNTHAWLQVYLPGAGWIDFDPTSGWVGNAGLVRAAAVRDPTHAAPLAGSFTGFAADYLGMSVNVEVTAEGVSTAVAAG